jgi:hypothetical protein
MDLDFSRSKKSLRNDMLTGRLHFPGRRYYTDGHRILSPTNRSGGAAMPGAEQTCSAFEFSAGCRPFAVVTATH